MNLLQQLDSDLKDAMRAGDVRKRDVIRYLRAAIANAAIEQRSELNDNQVQDIIRSQIKQRRDAVELFRQGGREELAEEEERQIEILQPYLPQQLSREELEKLVTDTAERLGAAGMKDMAKLMPALIQATEGRAEGRVLSELARNELARRAS